jgi:hypothetical protein
MKDRVVKFTGLTVNASDLLGYFGNRKIEAPFPMDWTRLEIPVTNFEYGTNYTDMMDEYIASHLSTRWGAYMNLAAQKIVVFFEDSEDAVMFKLMDGASAFLNKEEN